MHSAFLFVPLLLAASAHSAAVASRQVTSAMDVGAKPFLLVGSTAGASCPRTVQHGQEDVPALFGAVEGFGIEASINFTNIISSGDACSGSNSSAALVLLSQNELGRLNPAAASFLNLSSVAWVKVFIAGFDSSARECGGVVAPAPRFYAFIKEIDSFKPSLSALGLDIPNLVSRSGEKWMVSYIPSLRSVCAYIDSGAESVARAREAGIPFAQTDLSATPLVIPAPSPGPGDLIPVAGVSPEPTPMPNPFDSATPTREQAGSGRVCFPADATVVLEGGEARRMDELRVGDRVQVADGTFSDVFMFTHALSDVEHEFVEIQTETADRIALTEGHYLYVNGNLAAAKMVRIGDMVQAASGEPRVVAKLEVVRKRGLYNPQTVHGDIVVNGLRASTYTTAVQMGAAHALLAPLRALYERTGYFSRVLHEGTGAVAEFAPAGSPVLA